MTDARKTQIKHRFKAMNNIRHYITIFGDILTNLHRDATAKSFNFRSWRDGTWGEVFGGMVLTMQIENGGRAKKRVPIDHR